MQRQILFPFTVFSSLVLLATFLLGESPAGGKRQHQRIWNGSTFACTPLNIKLVKTLGVYKNEAGTRVFRGGVFVVFSLHVGLWDVSAVDFDVDLSVFFPFLLLFLECVSVVDEVEGQQEAQHTQSEQSDVDLKGKRQN